MDPDWKPYDQDLPFDKRPGRQFVHIDGFCEHSGVKWRRRIIGIAYLNNGGPQGYRREDIERLMREGDMEEGRVTFWAPAIFTWPPDV